MARGCLRICSGDVSKTIPIDLIESVIVQNRATSYSHEVVCAMLDHHIPLVACNDKHLPVGMLWPVASHHRQSLIIQRQASRTLTACKRDWKHVVQSKVKAQATLLKAIGVDGWRHLNAMSGAVKSGDPKNVEATAAAAYWKLLMGKDFRRNKAAPDLPNAALNYGYTILRAAMARALISAGLHPAFGIHHQPGQNPMPLVDDLMELYRPIVDCAMLRLLAGNERPEPKLSAMARTSLVDVLSWSWQSDPHTDEYITVLNSMQKTATAYAVRLVTESKSQILLPAVPPVAFFRAHA